MKRRNFSFIAAASIGLSAVQTASALLSPNENGYEMSERALQEFIHRDWGFKKFPYWNHVGKIGRSNGIFIGNGYILTAAHVGEGDFHGNDGRAYKMVSGSGSILRNPTGEQAAMLLFQIQVPRGSMLSQLESIPLTRAVPQSGERVLLMGAGAGK